MLYLDNIISSIQKTGGISVVFNELYRNKDFQRLNHQVAIYNNNTKKIKGITYVYKQTRRLERYRRCIIPKATKLFHSTYYRRPNKKVPTIVTVYDFVYERFYYGLKKYIHYWQKSNAITKADSIICISNSTKDDLYEFVGVRNEQKVYVIHNGVSEDFYPIKKRRDKKPYILFVGNRRGYKNFKLALLALNFIKDVNLYCIGGEELIDADIKDVSDEIKKRVFRFTSVSNKILNEFYNNAICLVYPSAYEGFGIPVIEAMRAGCPVICIDCKAVKEVGGDALLIAESGDAKEIADLIELALNSKRDSIIERGLNQAKKYSWKKTHDKTISIYKEMMTNS